jgi:hypothetical protein
MAPLINVCKMFYLVLLLPFPAKLSSKSTPNECCEEWALRNIHSDSASFQHFDGVLMVSFLKKYELKIIQSLG